MAETGGGYFEMLRASCYDLKSVPSSWIEENRGRLTNSIYFHLQNNRVRYIGDRIGQHDQTRDLLSWQIYLLRFDNSLKNADRKKIH